MIPLLTTSAREAKELYYSSKRESIIQRQAKKEWDKFSLIQAQDAQTISEFEEVYTISPPKSAAKHLAVVKWLEICTSLDQLRHIQKKTPKGSKDHWLVNEKIRKFKKQTK